MLNLLNLLTKKNTIINKIKKNEKSYKHFPSSLREWKNSVYIFNKNNNKLLPFASDLSLKLIKSYFNLYNKRLEFKMRTKKLLLRLRRLSSNRFYISSGGFKHTNNKVSINLYVFNRQKDNYLITLKKWFLKHLLITKVNLKERKNNIIKGDNFLQKKTTSSNIVSKINKNKVINIKKNNANINKKIIKRIKEINIKSMEKMKLLNNNSKQMNKIIFILNKTNYNVESSTNIKNYTNNFYSSLMKKSLRKIRMYFYYKQLMFLNKSKLNYTFLQYISKYLVNIFNKNIEFNIINLKKFYFNSDILSESIAIKLTKNRRKMFKYLTKLKDKVVVKKKRIMSFDKPKQNMMKRLNLADDSLTLIRYIVNNLKYKYVTGFRLEAKGRLSKRFTASRSVSKLIYKGNLLELDSSNRKWSSVLLKGNLRSNTQYTKIKSKSRIGSFGIKGWISGN